MVWRGGLPLRVQGVVGRPVGPRLDVMAEVPVVDARGFSKTFSGRKVLTDVDLAVSSGEIHALVGPNGSGKSTFIKILAGYHPPDPGATLAVRGHPVALPLSAATASHFGLSFVHQDLGLFEGGTVLENLLVGQYRTRFGWRIPWRSERARARSDLEEYGLDVDPDAPLATLTDVQRALLAIMRALIHLPASESALLVLDEPTARLPHDSAAEFFGRVRAIADRGHAVLFVSHRLDEVVTLANRVTVLRDGRIVARHRATDFTVRGLVTEMLGFEMEQLYPDQNHGYGEVVASIKELSGGVVRRFDADCHRGEILGLTGLLGMGHDAVPYLVFGAEPALSGTIEIAGTTIRLTSITPRRAMSLGMGLLPGNRARDSAVGEATARENLTLATLQRYAIGGRLRRGMERKDAQAQMARFEVAPVDPEAIMATFSGGNQQKTLLAKWLAWRPQLLILDEPWHGVDVGAKRQIMRLLSEAASDGMTIVISSVEAADLAEVCHRVLVMRRGEVATALAGSDLTSARISEQVQLDTDTRTSVGGSGGRASQ
jgi:ribose transport system ATP-binding protein